MATRHLLADLVAALCSARQVMRTCRVESMGGVDAAKRVAAGEPFDGVVLAAGRNRQADRAGPCRRRQPRGPREVADGGRRPARARRTRRSRQRRPSGRRFCPRAHIGYSTGPSGDHLLALFERWGIRAVVKDRLVQARPGIPVASLVASGEADLGFQQLSELLNVDGVDVAGPPARLDSGNDDVFRRRSRVRQHSLTVYVKSWRSWRRRRWPPSSATHGMEPA